MFGTLIAIHQRRESVLRDTLYTRRHDILQAIQYLYGDMGVGLVGEMRCAHPSEMGSRCPLVGEGDTQIYILLDEDEAVARYRLGNGANDMVGAHLTR